MADERITIYARDVAQVIEDLRADLARVTRERDAYREIGESLLRRYAGVVPNIGGCRDVERMRTRLAAVERDDPSGAHPLKPGDRVTVGGEYPGTVVSVSFADDDTPCAIVRLDRGGMSSGGVPGWIAAIERDETKGGV